MKHKILLIIICIFITSCTVNYFELDKVCQLKNHTEVTDIDIISLPSINYECDKSFIYYDGDEYCEYYSHYCSHYNKWNRCDSTTYPKIICNID